MSIRLAKFIAPALLAILAAPVSAQHGGHGGGHMGGGHMGGVYHAGYGGYGGYRGGYYGGYRGYGYGGYGLGYGYGGLGYGLGYGGLGYGGYGYGLGYGGLGYGSGYGGGYYSPYFGSTYSYPYTYSYPSTYSYGGTSYPYPSSIMSNGNIIQTSGYTPVASATAAPAVVTFTVPNDAQVWFNGKEATASGASRVFTSDSLQPGQSSVLSVKARWNGNDHTMQIPITAGDKMSVNLRDSQ